MPMNRREALHTLAALPLAARGLAASAQQPADPELIVCGWDEVFILVPGDGAARRKVWSWRAADSPEIPADMQRLFRTTDDCKPVIAGDGARRILISSSGGAVALVDRDTRRAPFVARVTNAHSIEMLPGGRVAAAASVSDAGTGDRLVVFDAASGRELAADPLRSGHGVVWDEARSLLWALGGDVLRAYAIGPAAGPTRLARAYELKLPSAGGHDLAAIPGSDRMFLSTVRQCYYFDRERRQLLPHDTLADRMNVKSYDVHPRTGRVVYVEAERPNWWSEQLHFQRPDGSVRLPGERLYKARWA